MARKQLVYGINDKPPLPILILAGAQHVLTLFGATTLVPLVLGPAMGMTTAQMGAFIGCVYFGMGIATLIQTHPKLGSGLPIVQGSSFSFIPPIMTIIGAYKSMGPDVVMQYVGGSLIVGGVALSALGYGRLIGRIRRIEGILREGLSPLVGSKKVADVRALGAIGVVELKKSVDMRKFQDALAARGVWLRPFGRLLYTMPPYIIDDGDLKTIAHALVETVEECAEL